MLLSSIVPRSLHCRHLDGSTPVGQIEIIITSQ